MEYRGGCHCGNLRVRLRLTKPPLQHLLRSCTCHFCRAHATRTVSDPAGLFEVWAADWPAVTRYRFDTRTADYLVCQRCGVYIGAVGETPAGLRAVINTHCLDDRAAFSQDAVRPDLDGEAVAARLARRAANWTPAVVHADAAAPPPSQSPTAPP